METHNMNKGFSLIELLVVIAIIGILSSVVIAAMESACKDNPDGCNRIGKQPTKCTTEQCQKFIRSASSTQQ